MPKFYIKKRHNNHHCKKIINFDILIIGAGPGGIGASLSLKNSNKKIALIDEKNSIGGQYYKKISKIFNIISFDKLDDQMKEGIQYENKILDTNINLFLGYKIWGAYKNQNSEYEICCSKDNIDLRILSKKLIIASGSFEKPFFVNGWHLPNVFTTGGTQILVNSQKLLPGAEIIICGNGPLNFQLANELKKGGAIVKAVVESSKSPFFNSFFSIFCFFFVTYNIFKRREKLLKYFFF